MQSGRQTEIKFVRLLRSIFDLIWVSNLQSSLKVFIELVGGVVILWVGGISVIRSEMTIGSLITFNSLIAYFLDPVKNLIDLQPQIQTAVVAADRLGEILDLEAEKTEAECRKLSPESLAGDIEIKNLNFRYGTRKPVLENINLTVKKQMETVSASKEASEKEKSQALSNLELQQLATIEQQISGYSDTIISVKTSLTSAKLQLESVNSAGNEVKENVAVLTEKGNIAAEILNYKEKAKECEAYLSSYDIQNNNCTVKAGVSGYYYATQDLKTGAYVQEGTKLGMIYPDEGSMYYAEVYVENSDIAMIKEGQEVKFEPCRISVF